MALRGISSKEVIPYVPRDDRDSPIEEQTVFWIKPKKFGDANATAARYMSSEKSISRTGFREIDPRRMTKADMDEFLAIVVKVENWIYSIDYSSDNRINPVLEDNEDLKHVCMDMSNDLLNEIFDVANDISKLKEGEKKFEILIYFNYWKSEDSKKSRLYDCDICERLGYLKTRNCFLETDYVIVPVPIIEEEDGQKVIKNQAVLSEVNEEEFFEVLMNIIEVETPFMPIFEVFMKYYGSGGGDCKPICLTSFIDPDYDFVIKLYDKCETYGCLPESGGLSDQPNKLIEAFDHIRYAKLQYENMYFERKTASSKTRS